MDIKELVETALNTEEMRAYFPKEPEAVSVSLLFMENAQGEMTVEVERTLGARPVSVAALRRRMGRVRRQVDRSDSV